MAYKRNTHQKELILSVLGEAPCHPTAGEVYERVRLRCPTVSRSTVFRVLSDQAAEGRTARPTATMPPPPPTATSVAAAAAGWRTCPGRTRRHQRIRRGSPWRAVPWCIGGCVPPAEWIATPKGVYNK